MKRIKTAAAQIGFGIATAYGFFLIPSIESLFSETFVLLLRQGLAISFAVCLLVNPKSIIELAELYTPKIIYILSMLFTNNHKKDEK